jgi:hypothetical protein
MVGALMALSFTVIESTMTPLWDFGWFDLSRFKIDGLSAEPPAAIDVLREFLRDAISQRSFCISPDPWGNTGGLHGPYPVESLEAEWYRSLSPEELTQRVARILNDADFTEPPSCEQRAQVSEWLDAARFRGDDVVVLEAPDRPGMRVDWDVWLIFHEFVSFSPSREDMTVAVIGYD